MWSAVSLRLLPGISAQSGKRVFDLGWELGLVGGLELAGATAPSEVGGVQMSTGVQLCVSAWP